MYDHFKFPISHKEAVLTLGISEKYALLEAASEKLTEIRNSSDIRVRSLALFQEEIAFATWMRLDKKEFFRQIFPVISDFTLALLFPDTRIEKDKTILKSQTYKEWNKLDHQFTKFMTQLKKNEDAFLPTAEFLSVTGIAQKKIESLFESAIKRQKQKSSWARFLEDLLPYFEINSAEKFLLFFLEFISEVPLEKDHDGPEKSASIKDGMLPIKKASLTECFRMYRKEKNLPNYQRGRRPSKLHVQPQ